MSDQTGPITLNLPARIIKTCSGCEFHKHTLVKSGNNPIYKDNCTHNIAPKDNRVSVFEVSGNLRSEDNHVIPGYWCPFLNKKQ